MSAYVVSPATIQCAVHAIARHCPRFGGGRFATPSDIRTPEAVKALSHLGDALWAMNREAVRQRYGQADAVPEFVFDPSKRPSGPQMKGAVQSIVYQCSEGDVPRTPLYRELEAAAAEISRQINEDGTWSVEESDIADIADPNAPDDMAARLARLEAAEDAARSPVAAVRGFRP